MASEPGRRLGGWVLVGLAVLTLMTAAGLNGRDTRGLAVTVPPVPPPAVGSCLTLAPDGPVALSCTSLHSAEVLAAWPTGAPAPAAAQCRWDGRRGLLPAAGDGWRPPPYSAFVHLVSAGGPVGWTACVQQPIATVNPVGVVVYRGSLLAATSIAGYPAELRACYWQTAAKAAAHPVSCTEPHDAELLAISTRRPAPGGDCAAVAAGLIGSARVFAGPQALLVGDLNLAATGRIVIDVEDGRQDRHTQPFLTAGTFPARPLSSCAIRVQPGRWLVSSVVGLGDAPLPYGGPS